MDSLRKRFKYDPLGLLRHLYPEAFLPSRASEKEISKAYRKALKRYHPDRLRNLPPEQQFDYEEKFRLLNEFKERIMNASRYTVYE
eukprot:UN07923